MTWTTQKTWVASELVDESELNTYIRDDMNHLYVRVKPIPFFPVEFPAANDDIGTGWNDTLRIVNNDNNDSIQLNGIIPDDFSSLDTLVIGVWASANTTLTYNAEVGYGGVGEDVDATNNSTTGGTVAITANDIAEIDLSGLAASLAAGDYVGIYLEGDATAPDTNVNFVGIRALYVPG